MKRKRDIASLAEEYYKNYEVRYIRDVYNNEFNYSRNRRKTKRNG